MLKRSCEWCDKPLRKIGYDRVNGKLKNNSYNYDWVGRKYHKKCYPLALFHKKLTQEHQ